MFSDSFSSKSLFNLSTCLCKSFKNLFEFSFSDSDVLPFISKLDCKRKGKFIFFICFNFSFFTIRNPFKFYFIHMKIKIIFCI